MEKLKEVSCVGQNIGWGKVLENHHGRVNGIRLMETQIWFLPKFACWEWGVLNNVTMDSASISVCEEAALSALTPKPDNLLPPLIPPATFKMLHHHWSSE